ncbi:hypothetical protein F0562_033974 [Nyssa sinensis]|uniref:Uncharacterized protein n=1 Tax=Nyssa sinensis TaxID=561372 RepID=A0A5J5AIG3_9ASTE|nr:hypothetical protein F0562_033974 [Nyssa sinensis]
MMIQKAYSLFLCTLLISVLFVPLTSARKLQSNDAGGHHDKHKHIKTGVPEHHSHTAPSATQKSPPVARDKKDPTKIPCGTGNRSCVPKVNERSKAAAANCGRGLPAASCVPEVKPRPYCARRLGSCRGN